MQRDSKHDADSGNDSTNEMLQKEKLIDPGNEHTHHKQADDELPSDTAEQKRKHDADAGSDGTGTSGPEPAPEQKDKSGRKAG